MWTLDSAASTLTNKVVIPTDGKIEVSSTGNTQVTAYINDQVATPIDRLWVQAGDIVHFDIKGDSSMPTTVTLQYGGAVDTLQIATGTTLTTEENIMTPADTVNLFANPNQGMGGALGGGLGAGLVGGLLGTMLFRRGGLDGEVGGGGVATQMGVEATVNNSSIQQTLGDIKASIPLAESQVQTALGATQADINNNISNHASNILQSMSTSDLQIANQFGQTNLNVATVGTAVREATASINSSIKDASILAERNAWAITQAITNDGDKTRALIQSIDKTNDSRTITALANEISDLKNTTRLNDATHSLTINNNNNAIATAQQQQAQQQQQLQYQILAQLSAVNADLQSVKQNSVVFNSGLMAGSGNQTGANTRVA